MHEYNLLDAHIHTTHMTTEPEAKHYFSVAVDERDWTALLQNTDSRSKQTMQPSIHRDQQPSPPLTSCFLGIHPQRLYDKTLPELKKILQQDLAAILSSKRPYMLGVGECGLDKRFLPSIPLEHQLKLLTQQVEIAKEFHCPLMFHQVHMLNYLFPLLKSYTLKEPFILHGFSGSYESALSAVKLGGYLSIGQTCLLPQAKIRMVLPKIPIERLLVETDYPFIPKTGNTDIPTQGELLQRIYQEISLLTGIDRDGIIAIVQKNGKIFTNNSDTR